MTKPLNPQLRRDGITKKKNIRLKRAHERLKTRPTQSCNERVTSGMRVLYIIMSTERGQKNKYEKNQIKNNSR